MVVIGLRQCPFLLSDEKVAIYGMSQLVLHQPKLRSYSWHTAGTYHKKLCINRDVNGTRWATGHSMLEHAFHDGDVIVPVRASIKWYISNFFENFTFLNHLPIANVTAPGETYDIEFAADNPGTEVFHCHLPHHTAGPNGGDGGMLTTFHYQGTPWPPAFMTTSTKTSNMGDMNTRSSNETLPMA